MNSDIGQTVKHCSTCLEYQHTLPHEKTLHNDIPYKPWTVVGDDIFMINNKTLLCIVDYYRKCQVVKWVASLSADDLGHAAKMTSAEFGLPRKSISCVDLSFCCIIFLRTLDFSFTEHNSC